MFPFDDVIMKSRDRIVSNLTECLFLSRALNIRVVKTLISFIQYKIAEEDDQRYQWYTNLPKLWGFLNKTIVSMKSKNWINIKGMFRGINEIIWYEMISNMHVLHYDDVTWAPWCLKPLATPLFVQQLDQANNKENTKAQHWWPCVRRIQQ